MKPLELQLTLPLPLMSKARPRFTRTGRTYLPEAYRAWRHQAQDLLKGHWLAFDLPTVCSGRVALTFYGPARHDLDNLVGAVLDAGLPDKATGWRGCWRDDRVGVFPALQAEWIRSRDQRIDLRITAVQYCES